MTSHAQPVKPSTVTATSPPYESHNGLLYTANKPSLPTTPADSTTTERPPPVIRTSGKLSGKFPCQKVSYVRSSP
jgi:hypothetical protein